MGAEASNLESKMTKLEEICVLPSNTIREVLEIIDKNSKQLALVTDGDLRLIGTISDGDVRRALLKGYTLDNQITDIYFKDPTYAKISDSKESIIRIATNKKIHQIPIIDSSRRLVGLDVLDELLEKTAKNNKVVLMVGGLGIRLRPLTENVPKPMLKVGNKPILETIVEKFAEYGYNEIIMCVNYKSQVIQDYFRDGSKFGVSIQYLVEEQRMGTAGALSLINQKIEEHFFVMNGDLLTNVNFEHLQNYHVSNESSATMCVREYIHKVPYGVVNLNDNKIESIKEKPEYKFFVSAGIYMLSPSSLEFIPKNEYYDMPTLFEKLIKNNKKTISFPIREYWLDIGRIEEFEKANNEYHEVF